MKVNKIINIENITKNLIHSININTKVYNKGPKNLVAVKQLIAFKKVKFKRMQ